MTKTETLLHRANELALTCEFAGWEDIVERLQAEGFSEAKSVFGDRTLQIHLDRACEDAKGS